MKIFSIQIPKTYLHLFLLIEKMRKYLTQPFTNLEWGQAFDYLIRNESSFFAPFSFNQSHRKELTYSGFQPPFVIPPVQIRTCAANASGSCFESDAQTLPFGAPCLNRSLILPASELRTQEGKQNSSQPSPFAPPGSTGAHANAFG